MKFHLILLLETIKSNLTCDWKPSLLFRKENKILEGKFFSFGFPIFLLTAVFNSSWKIRNRSNVLLNCLNCFESWSKIELGRNTLHGDSLDRGGGVIDDFHLHEAWLNVARGDCDGATMRLRERQWNLAAPLYILLHCLRVKTSRRRRRVEIGQGKKCRGVPTRVRDTPSPPRKNALSRKKNHFLFFFFFTKVSPSFRLAAAFIFTPPPSR